MDMLEVRNLTIEMHDHSIPETVVHDFNLTIEEGEIVGIVGESGSGKTMTALAIASLLERKDVEKKGNIIFQGIDLLQSSKSQIRELQGNEISMIFQEPMTSLNPVKKIGWQVEECLSIHTKLNQDERKKKAMDMLTEVGIHHVEWVYDAYPHQLSGGMRQRVMIAAAMICQPKLLIADEPTTALDVTIQAQILNLLKRVTKKSNTAVLFISHDLSLVRKLCHRVMVMQGGYVVEQGQTAEIFNHPQNAYTKELIDAIPTFCKDERREIAIDKSDEKVLVVENLEVAFSDGMKRLFSKNPIQHVLKGINLSIREGEMVGLVGESGCGKSTLAKCILGLNQTYQGSIRHSSNMPQMIFQDPYGSLNPMKKIKWILMEPLRLHTKLSKQQMEQKAIEMLEIVGLGKDIGERYPSQLSGGQRQRVGIATALMLEPSLLVADEPVSALDVTMQVQIIQLLLALHNDRGLAMLFISHDLRVVYQICDRVIIMQQGVIVEEGSVEKVFFHPEHEYTKKLLAATEFEE